MPARSSSSVARLAAAGSRRLSTPAVTKHLASLKEKEAEAQKLMPFLPESLKKLAEFQTWELTRMEDFAARQPELLAELCARKEANPTVSGIVATTVEPRDPALCKYTVEGSVVHDVMGRLATMERAKATMYDGLFITLTPADKAKWKEKVIESMAAHHKKIKAMMGDTEWTPPEIVVADSDIPDKIPFTGSWAQ